MIPTLSSYTQVVKSSICAPTAAKVGIVKILGFGKNTVETS